MTLFMFKVIATIYRFSFLGPLCMCLYQVVWTFCIVLFYVCLCIPDTRDNPATEQQQKSIAITKHVLLLYISELHVGLLFILTANSTPSCGSNNILLIILIIIAACTADIVGLSTTPCFIQENLANAKVSARQLWYTERCSMHSERHSIKLVSSAQFREIWTYSGSRSLEIDDFGTNRKRICTFY